MGNKRHQNRLLACVLTALYAAGLLVTGCDAKPVPSAEESTSIIVTSESTEKVVQATSAETSAVAMPTPTLTPILTPPITFDLTEEATPTTNPLMFLAGFDQAVIVGGEAPSIVEASFHSGLETTDWNIAGIDNDYCEYSVDRSGLAFLKYNQEERSLLYYDGNEIREVASDVNSYTLSLSGNVIAYTVQNGDYADLYLYDIPTGEARLAAEKLSRFSPDICISPSGDAFAYRDESEVLHLTVGDKKEELPVPGDVLAISDGGELIYYTIYDNGTISYYVLTEEKSIPLAAEMSGKNVSNNSDIIFNRDLTQALIAVNNKLLFTKDGSKPVCISALPKETLTEDSSGNYPETWGFRCLSTPALIRKESTMFLPARNLIDQVYRFSDTILFLNRKLEAQFIADNTYEPGPEASLSGDSIAYLQKSPGYDGFDVYYKADYRGSDPAVRIPVEYAEKVVLTPDQSIYVENDIGQIYCIRGMSSPVLVDTHANLVGKYEDDGSTCVYYVKSSYSDKAYTYLYDLYRIADIPEGEPQQVATDIYEVYIDATGIYLLGSSSYDDGFYAEAWYEDVRYSTNGKTFKFLCTKVFGP